MAAGPVADCSYSTLYQSEPNGPPTRTIRSGDTCGNPGLVMRARQPLKTGTPALVNWVPFQDKSLADRSRTKRKTLTCPVCAMLKDEGRAPSLGPGRLLRKSGPDPHNHKKAADSVPKKYRASGLMKVLCQSTPDFPLPQQSRTALAAEKRCRPAATHPGRPGGWSTGRRPSAPAPLRRPAPAGAAVRRYPS